jgi:hypothetical protein
LPKDIGESPSVPIYRDQKITKIQQARHLLIESMETGDPLPNESIQEVINQLNNLELGLKNPGGHYPPNQAKKDSNEPTIRQIQGDIATLTRRFEQFLEQAQAQTQNQGTQGKAAKPTYAEKAQKGSKTAPQIQVVVPPPGAPLGPRAPQKSTPPRTPRTPTRATLDEPKPIKSGSIDYKEKRLILEVPPSFMENLNPMAVRNQINDLFFAKGFEDPILASVNKSATKLSLILTTMEGHRASFLKENQPIWESAIPFTKCSYDQPWTKIVVHSIPCQAFNHPEGIDSLRQEIETFNPYITQMRDPHWLTSEENRATKRHASAIIYLETKEMASQAIEARVNIAGVPCRAETFFERFIQCAKCQKFGHTRIWCRNQAKCLICAQEHETKAHYCPTCEIYGKECPHTKVCCPNCGLDHKGNDQKCGEWQRVQPKARSRFPIGPQFQTTRPKSRDSMDTRL